MSTTGVLTFIVFMIAIMVAAAVTVGLYLLIRYAWILITARLVISVSEAISAKKQPKRSTKKK